MNQCRIKFKSIGAQQQAFEEDNKLDISIKNEDNVNTKTDLSVKTENDKVETTVKLNDDPEKEKKKQNYKKTIVMS
jgi:hypothetical protein